jgi:isoleucyl-tRNA synthetase
MDLVRDMVGLGRGIREKERIKVRQPLRSILVDGKYASLIRDMVPLIKDELNVKEVIFEKDLTEYMSYSLKPDFKVAGPLLGGKIKAFAVALSKEDPADFVSRMKKEGGIHMELEGENVNITPEMTDIRIDAKEGFAVAMEGNLFTILDTGLDRELVEEGLAREIVSKVQQLRKQKDFEMMDNIIITLDAGEEVKEAIKKYEKYIMKETLATEIKEDKTKEKYNINGHDTGIDVKKI